MANAIIKELNLSDSTIEKIDEKLSRAYEKGMSQEKIEMAVSMMINRLRYLRETVRNIINLCHGMKKNACPSNDIKYILHQIQNEEFIFDQSKKVLQIKNWLSDMKKHEMDYVIREINKNI